MDSKSKCHIQSAYRLSKFCSLWSTFDDWFVCPVLQVGIVWPCPMKAVFACYLPGVKTSGTTIFSIELLHICDQSFGLKVFSGEKQCSMNSCFTWSCGHSHSCRTKRALIVIICFVCGFDYLRLHTDTDRYIILVENIISKKSNSGCSTCR